MDQLGHPMLMLKFDKPPAPTPCCQSCESALWCLFVELDGTAKEHQTFDEPRKTKAKQPKRKEATQMKPKCRRKKTLPNATENSAPTT